MCVCARVRVFVIVCISVPFTGVSSDIKQASLILDMIHAVMKVCVCVCVFVCLSVPFAGVLDIYVKRTSLVFEVIHAAMKVCLCVCVCV